MRASTKKKKRERKKERPIFCFLIVFVLAFLSYVVIGWKIFPKLPDGTIDVPVWYMVLSFPFSAATSLIIIFLKSCIRRIVNYFDPLGERLRVSSADLNYLYKDAVSVVIETNNATASNLQRKLNVSFHDAQELIGKMEMEGIVGPFLGTEPRKIYLGKAKAVRDHKNHLVKPETNVHINIEQIIQEENEWRRKQKGLSSEEAELEKIDFMEGHQFEHWCAGLLQRIGFVNVEVTQGSGDQGVDVLAEKDGIKYAIQCKCYSSDLGNKPIQEVNTGKAIYHCQIGAVITNRYFTQGGKEAAKATGILLWDRDWIREKLKEAEK